MDTIAFSYAAPMSEFDPTKLPLFEREEISILKSHLDFYEYAVEVAADEVFLMKDDSQILYVNQSACSRLGYERDELIGKYVWEWDPLFPKDVWPSFFEDFKQKKHIHFETLHQTKQGDTFPVEIHAHLYKEDNQNFLLAFVNDLTENKKTEEELSNYREHLEDLVESKTAELKVAKENAEQANKAKSEFLSTMSHELRTPITSIKGSLSLISNDIVTDPDQVKDMLTIAHKNSERLERLVNDILDFEKLRRDGIDFNNKKTDVGKLVRDAISMESGYAVNFNIKITLDDKNYNDTCLYIDPHRIQQVIANLLSNAIKFSPPGEEIDVKISNIDKKLRLSVTDKGKGIDESFREKIFTPFYQIDASDSRDKGGTGLGLAISRQIIENYKGKIGFACSPDNGTCFFFELDENHIDSKSSS